MANATVGNAVPDMGLAGLKMAGALFFLLALIFLGFWLLKRYGHKAGITRFKNKELSIFSQLSLGPRKSIVVVRFLNKLIMLGVTDSRIEKLTEVEADHESLEGTSFQQLLQESSRSQDTD